MPGRELAAKNCAPFALQQLIKKNTNMKNRTCTLRQVAEQMKEVGDLIYGEESMRRWLDKLGAAHCNHP